MDAGQRTIGLTDVTLMIDSGKRHLSSNSVPFEFSKDKVRVGY